MSTEKSDLLLSYGHFYLSKFLFGVGMQFGSWPSESGSVQIGPFARYYLNQGSLSIFCQVAYLAGVSNSHRYDLGYKSPSFAKTVHLTPGIQKNIGNLAIAFYSGVEMTTRSRYAELSRGESFKLNATTGLRFTLSN